MNEQILERFQIYSKSKSVDLKLESVKFTKVALAEQTIFKFVKGQNKYIRKTIAENQGEIPVVGASLENQCIYDHVTPLDDNDVVNKSSVSFNKDNAKGSRAFFRDYPYVMDRHHIAIIPDQEKIDPEYFYFFFDNFLKSQGYGWGENVATVEAVQAAEIPIPHFANEDSIKIQKILVAFIKYEQGKNHKKLKTLSELYEKFELLEKLVVPRTLEKSKSAMEKFGRFLDREGKTLDLEELQFETKRILSSKPEEVVCSKRMGFTPERDSEGDINWFTVSDLNAVDGLRITNPKTKEKTNIDLVKKSISENSTKFKSIQKGEVMVSFKLTVGVVKIYDSDEKAYCNEAIDILTPGEQVTSEFLALNSMIEYPKYGSITNNGKTLNDDHKKEIQIKIPKSTSLPSKDIQKLITSYIEKYISEINAKKEGIKKIETLIPHYQDAFVQTLFTSLKNQANGQ